MSLRASAAVAAFAALGLALPAIAGANPTVTVGVTAQSTNSLPATATHRLTLGAGSSDEVVTITAPGEMRLGGDAQAVGTASALAAPVARCPGRRQNLHPNGQTGTVTMTVRVPAGRSGWVDTDARLVAAPWTGEDLSMAWEVDPADGPAYVVMSEGPRFAGPFGVHVSGLHVHAAAGGRNVISGVLEPAVRSGRVEIWGYAPGSSRARRIASVAPRGDNFSYAGWRPKQAGRWELYARYRTAGRTYANDGTECGSFVRVR